MTFLSRTQNFYRLYRYCAGPSEVPEIYHYWCCLSLIAAVLEDRVYLEFYRNKPIFPNLYVMLLGPSGVAKGLAITEAMNLYNASENTQINCFRGSITAPYLVDHLGGVTTSTEDGQGRDCVLVEDAKLWLVMDELANNITAGGQGMTKAFIRMMTELYTGQYVFNKGDRSHGLVTVDNACINWLCGTTKDWLLEVLTRDMVHSGFTPRVLPIYSNYREDKVRWPTYPDDWHLVYEHLKARLYVMRCVTGRFEISPKADAVYSKWWETRVPPEDDAERPFYQRERVLLFKLSMLISMMDGGPLVIKTPHVERAVFWLRKLALFQSQLLEIASVSRETSTMMVVFEVVKKRKSLTRTELTRAVQRKGIDARKLDAAVKDLIQGGRITTSTGKKGATIYTLAV